MATTRTSAARLPQVRDCARLFPWALSLCLALAACGDSAAPHHASSVERLATAVTARPDAADVASDVSPSDVESDIFDVESDTADATVAPDVGPDVVVPSPTVAEVSPSDGAHDVALDAVVVIRFARTVAEDERAALTPSLIAAARVRAEPAPIGFTTAWSAAGDELTLTPDADLDLDRGVTVGVATTPAFTSRFTTRGPRAPSPDAPLDADTLADIDLAMRDALDVPSLAGRTFGGFVQDLENGQVIWQLDGDRVLIPASNTKVFTTACALDRLGVEHRMLTRVFAATAIDAGGTLAGDLDLHSEHDFTWSRWFYADERHPLDRIADALWQIGLRQVDGNLGIWGAYLYDGYHFGTYDPAAQRARVAIAWRAALTARGITVTAGTTDHATMDLPPGSELTRWESIPLGVAEWAINRISHNEMADVLARHLGYLEAGSSDYVAGASVVHDWLVAAGVDATGFEVHDGSGLSIDNRISAHQLVGLYGYMTKSRQELWPMFRSSLSVGGAEGPGAVDGDGEAIVTSNIAPYNGTLGYRMSGADVAGRVFGKSGTNAGITTSGVLYHRYDGHRYAFAFLMNTLPADTAATARVTQDALVTVIARDWRDRGARPLPPTLGCVAGRDDGSIAVSFAPVAGVTPGEDTAGYWVETSRDGVTWREVDRHFTLETDKIIDAPVDRDADRESAIYVRVRAVTLAGTSDASDVYAARAVAGAPKALIVDADDRWQRQPTNENLIGENHAFAATYAAAMPAGVAFDTCPNEAVAGDAATVALAGYDAVLWDAAEESASDESIAAVEATILSDYLSVGGSLFVSGAEVAWDLDARGNPGATAADETFYATWLRADYAGDDAETFVAEGVPGSIFADRTGHLRLGFWTPGQIFVAYPDELAPMGGATAALAYDGPGTTAAIQYQGDYDLVSFGFPFESIDGAPERALVMQRVLAFFGLTTDR